MKKPALFILAAFLGLLWAAHRFGGLCTFMPVILAILAFTTVVVPSMLTIMDKTKSRIGNSLAGFGMAVMVLGGALIAAQVGHDVKYSMKPSDVGITLGATKGTVVSVHMWAPIPGPGDFKLPKRRCRVIYTYSVQGSTFRQCDYFVTRSKAYKTGVSVTVLYSLSRPELARLLRHGESLPEGTAIPSGDSM